MGENKKKCSYNCMICEYYDNVKDYCKEKKIENISEKPHTDFSQCESYLVKESLVLF